MKNQIKNLESAIFNNCVIKINELLGTNKTSFLATSILLKMKPQVILTQLDDIKVSKKDNLVNFSKNVAVIYNSELEIHYFYKKDKDINKLAVLTDQYSFYLVYLILREIIIILNKYNVLSIRTELMKDYTQYSEAQIIVDIEINKLAHSFMNELYNVSKMSDEFKEISKVVVFPSKEHYTNLTEIKKTKLNKTLKRLVLPAEFYSNVDQMIVRDYSNKGVTGYQKHDKNKEMNKDVQISNLADLISKDISTNSKGTSIGKLFNILFESVKVDVLWFKRLKKNIKTTIRSMTSSENRNWANMNSMKRHLYPAPAGKKNKFKLELIISIDQSASMSTKQLREILYLFEQESKKISKVTVLLHTSAVVKTFVIEDSNDISNDGNFKKALSTRHGSGGTSFVDVWDHISKLDIKNPKKTIYLAFSDFYADVEETIHKYPIMQKIQKYWIYKKGDHVINTKKVGGQNIEVQ